MNVTALVANPNLGRIASNGGLGVYVCRCGNTPANPPHPCPYAEEIGGNHEEEYCDCCDDCRHECAMDI